MDKWESREEIYQNDLYSKYISFSATNTQII